MSGTGGHIGLLLAGGRARRMGGGDKVLLEIGGVRLIDRAVARLAPQVNRVIISTNGNAESLTDCGVPIIDDGAEAGRGPLSGILAGLRWGSAHLGGEAVLVSVPADTPFFPPDLVSRLAAARLDRDMEIAVAGSHGRSHHAVAAWPVSLADDLEAWLAASRTSAVREFLASRRAVTVEFGGTDDPFFNVNLPEDLETARRIAAEQIS